MRPVRAKEKHLGTVLSTGETYANRNPYLPSRCLICNLCLSPMQPHSSKRTLSEATAKAQRSHSEPKRQSDRPTTQRTALHCGLQTAPKIPALSINHLTLTMAVYRPIALQCYSATVQKRVFNTPVFICKTICVFNSAFAPSGRKLVHPIPRALPWAICFWPFRPSIGHGWMIHFDSRITGNRTVTTVSEQPTFPEKVVTRCTGKVDNYPFIVSFTSWCLSSCSA